MRPALFGTGAGHTSSTGYDGPRRTSGIEGASMAIDLTLGTPTFQVTKGPPTSGVGVRVTVTNGPEALDAHQTSLQLTGLSGETSEMMGDNAEPLNAFAAGESR